MADTPSTAGLREPPTPASTESSSYLGDTESGSAGPSDASSGRSFIEDTFYRSRNLAVNGIWMRQIDEEFPDDVARLVRDVGRDRDTPGLSVSQVLQDKDLHALEMGADKNDVEEYFRAHVYPYPGATESLKRSDKQPMSNHAIPSTGSSLRVSKPAPDMLYGYSNAAFPDQQAQLISMGTEMSANNQGLMYPFLAVEVEGDGPGGASSLWAATSQCLGSSASCVKITERINCQLKRCVDDKVPQVDSAAFSIAMSGTEARLYVSWKHGEIDYYVRKVKSFLLQEPEQYLEFRRYVRNIINWGEEARLGQIRASLDALLEDKRKTASEAAKSRQPPSDGSAAASGSSRKRRPSWAHIVETNNGDGPRQEEDGPYWDWDDVVSKWYHEFSDGTILWKAPEIHFSPVVSGE